MGSVGFEVKCGSLGGKAVKVQTIYEHLDEKPGKIINNIAIFKVQCAFPY
jgi:hypothetical protein